MENSALNILELIILAGLLSIVYGYFTGKDILNSSAGNNKMQEIASAIQVGAKAYLNRQYKTIAIVGLVVLVIISYAFSILVGLGYSGLVVHLLGLALLLARVCHAYGIQLLEAPLPKSRVLGNILTWIIYLVISSLLILSYFTS